MRCTSLIRNKKGGRAELRSMSPAPAYKNYRCLKRTLHQQGGTNKETSHTLISQPWEEKLQRKEAAHCMTGSKLKLTEKSNANTKLRSQNGAAILTKSCGKKHSSSQTNIFFKTVYQQILERAGRSCKTRNTDFTLFLPEETMQKERKHNTTSIKR